MAIFTMLSLPIHKHRMFFNLFLSYFLEQWLVVLLEEVLHIPCKLYSQLFYSLGSNCEWEFTHDLALCLLLVYRNACDFCILILYTETLLKLLISLRRFGAETVEFSKYTVMSSANRDNLSSSLPIEYPLFLSLARLPYTMLNRSGEKGHLCLMPVFNGDIENN